MFDLINALSSQYSTQMANNGMTNIKFMMDQSYSSNFNVIIDLLNSVSTNPSSYKDFSLVCEKGKCICSDCHININFPYYFRYEIMRKTDPSYDEGTLRFLDIYFIKCGNNIIHFTYESAKFGNEPNIYGNLEIKYTNNPSVPGL